MKDRDRKGISPFSAVILMIALSVVGIICIPRLKVQLIPLSEGHTAEVTYSYPEASAQMVESEVTSKLEGMLSRIRNVTDVSSLSSKGKGYVTIRFRKGTNMNKARLEMVSAIRNIYPSLPQTLSFPTITLSASEETRNDVSLSYTLKGAMPTQEIERFARECLLPPISALNEVSDILLSGATPFEWVITFKASTVRALGIEADAISEAFKVATSGEVMGRIETSDGQMTVRLAGLTDKELGSIPIRTNSGQVFYLRDLATWQYKESEPQAYFRVNGLNTITMAISTASTSNLVLAVKSIKEEMTRLQQVFPNGIQADVSYDASDYIKKELDKIYLRTGLCLLILLSLVLLSTSSWRYLFVLTSTIVVNILCSLFFYSVIDIPIHVYTLAGITVSLGVVMDMSIIMVDHYVKSRNRKVFPSLVSATFTTVVALLVIFLLPESERHNLSDFVWVVVINLLISLFVAYLFVPSLLELMKRVRTDRTLSASRLRSRARIFVLYKKYLLWGCRWRFIIYLLFLTLFVWAGYRFYKGMDRINLYREPERKQLYIQAGMMEGSTVAQLNEVIQSMENYLAQFGEIESYITRITSASSGNIVVWFKPEWEDSSFPFRLKAQVISAASDFGGANWSVYGIDDESFNNHIVTFRKGNRVRLSGYNYQQLLQYANKLIVLMESQPRIEAPEIWTANTYYPPSTEYKIEYDSEYISAMGADPYLYYYLLKSRLYNHNIGYSNENGKWDKVVLRSSEMDSYDLWHILNEPIQMDSLLLTLADVGDIKKSRTGIDIRRENRVYQVDVCFDYVGSAQSEQRIIGELVNRFNQEVLPVGYKAQWGNASWFDEHKEDYLWLILLIVAIIYVSLSMSLNSVKLPIAIISLIPVSFIGLFLVFGYSHYPFDQGGFAALVMLSGIVVNSGIYLVTSYRQLCPSRPSVSLFIKAFRFKIRPILLTVASTVLGLLPFFSDGPGEVFWFDFALGTISGLLFSLIALVLLLPLLILVRRKR